MKQYLLISLMTIFILGSCKKEPKENKTDPGTILQGWQITKTKYDFNIIPDDLFFKRPRSPHPPSLLLQTSIQYLLKFLFKIAVGIGCLLRHE